MKHLALLAGLTRVDPAGYNGWHGDCPGCDIDIELARDLAMGRAPYSYAMLLNQFADKPYLDQVFRTTVPRLERGDLLFLDYSGHGGQTPDENGDETDGLDETICLHSGQVNDDVIHGYLCMIPAGVRVFFISDSCNAALNYRGIPPAPIPQTPMSFERILPAEFQGEMIHFAGCREGFSSYGDKTGGVWTATLFNTLRQSPGLSYREWFDAAAAKMPANQVPVYSEYGVVSSAFRNGPALM